MLLSPCSRKPTVAMQELSCTMFLLVVISPEPIWICTGSCGAQSRRGETEDLEAECAAMVFAAAFLHVTSPIPKRDLRSLRRHLGSPTRRANVTCMHRMFML